LAEIQTTADVEPEEDGLKPAWIYLRPNGNHLPQKKHIFFKKKKMIEGENDRRNPVKSIG